MTNRDAVRSKPKKTILTQKVQNGKKMGSPRPIPAFSEETKPEQKPATQQKKKWKGQHAPDSKVDAGRGYFVTHDDGSFDGPYHGD